AVAEETKQLSFRDDFAIDSRAQYTVQGTIAWQKGLLTLTEGARLARKLDVGHRLEVRAVLRLAPGDGDAQLTLRVSGGQHPLRLELAREQGQVRLRQRAAASAQEVILAGPGPWALRCQVRWGLTQFKAWPVDAAEPAAWQAPRYIGDPAWRPETLT